MPCTQHQPKDLPSPVQPQPKDLPSPVQPKPKDQHQCLVKVSQSCSCPSQPCLRTRASALLRSASSQETYLYIYIAGGCLSQCPVPSLSLRTYPALSCLSLETYPDLSSLSLMT